MKRGVWQATVYNIAESNMTELTHMHGILGKILMVEKYCN